jgi:hypothetical protein
MIIISSFLRLSTLKMYYDTMSFSVIDVSDFFESFVLYVASLITKGVSRKICVFYSVASNEQKEGGRGGRCH